MKFKNVIFSLIIVLSSKTTNAQLIDWSKIDLNSLLNKVLTVKQGWAPKFSIGNLSLDKINKVTKLINLKNIDKATKLYNTFKTGRAVYKIGAYVGMATSLYSSIQNIVVNGKLNNTTIATEIAAYKDQINKAKNKLLAGGLTVATGVIIKFLTKQAASKAATEFNGMVKNKIKEKIKNILSLDAATPSNYAMAGVALKIKL